MGIGTFLKAAKIGVGLLKDAYKKVDDQVKADVSDDNNNANEKIDLDDKVEKTAKVRI